MKRLVIRADDLGYCEAVNYGIEKTVKEGLIKNVSLMPNMPAAAHGISILKGTDVVFGQHTNVCLGPPCSNPEKIPSLVDQNGQLKSSREYRQAYMKGEDFTRIEDMVLEIEAQYFRFRELTGREPEYLDAHGAMSKNLISGLKIVADRYNLPLMNMTAFDKEGSFRGKPIAGCAMNCMLPPDEYDAVHFLEEEIDNLPEDIPGIYVCHPGYLDEYLLSSSSLTINRTKEVTMLCDKKVRKMTEDKGVELITYNDI